MHYTIFNTPVLKTFLMGVSLLILKILGWQKTGQPPDIAKYVLVVAPHTSNWDLFYGILLAFTFKLDVRFIAKKELFRGPSSWLMRWLGGLPIDRTSSSNVINQMISVFHERKYFALALAPEDTRHRVNGWKSGFYHIAVSARVPIQLRFLDYATKTGGAGPLFYSKDDLNYDMKIIRNFYATVGGKYSGQASPVVLLSKL